MIDLLRYFSRGLRDLFTREVLLVAAFPLVLILLLFAGEIAVSVLWLIPWLQAQLHWLEGRVAILAFQILLALLLLGFFAILNVLLAVTLIGVFFTEKMVDLVNRTYYRKPLAPFGTNRQIVAFSLKTFTGFLGLFLLLSPFFLIPGLNLIAFALPSFLYFQKTVIFDVASQSVSRPVYEELLTRHRRTLRLLLIPLYLLSYLPVIGIFSYLYAFLVVSHFVLDRQPSAVNDGSASNFRAVASP